MEHVNRNFSLFTLAPPQKGRAGAFRPSSTHESIARDSSVGDIGGAGLISPLMGSPIDGETSQPVGSELPSYGAPRHPRRPHNRGGISPYQGRSRPTEGEITPHSRGGLTLNLSKNQRLTALKKLPCMYCLSIKSTYKTARRSKANAQRGPTALRRATEPVDTSYPATAEPSSVLCFNATTFVGKQLQILNSDRGPMRTP